MAAAAGKEHSGGLGRHADEEARESARIFRCSSQVGGPISFSLCPFTWFETIVEWCDL